ncbi:MAG: hypothetical protein AB1631_06415 [Acidobacteriota bacterium]
MSVRDNDELKEIGFALHARLLVERGRVAEQISELFLPLIINALGRKFPALSDPHLVETAAADAVMAYLRRPEKFDPTKSSLVAWLYLDARTNLLNLLDGQKRIERHRVEIARTLLSDDGTIDPERALIEEESPVIKTVRETITDPRDQEIVALLAEGERETARFAEVLEIEHVSAIEQAVAVKRHKDRLKVSLRRALRRRLLSILITLAAFGRRVKAAARQNPAQSLALASAIIALMLANLFLWQKTNATGARTESAVEMIDPAPDNRDEEAKQSGTLRADEFVEKIFFYSDRAAVPGTSQLHIFMMNVDGSEIEQVTFGDVADTNVDVSPDGTKIAFSRRMSPVDDDYPYGSVWVKDLLSGIEIPVTVEIDHPWGPYQSVWPSWSPDGKQIAISRLDASPSPSDDLRPGIWIVDFLPSIGEPRRVTPPKGFGRSESVWSSDGRIYYSFQTVKDANYAIYRIDPRTGVEEEVIPVVRDDLNPKVSPDGKKLAWRAYRHSSPSGDVYVADVSNPVGSQLRLTPCSGWEICDWSPDGTRILMKELRFRLTDEDMKEMISFVPADAIAGLECARRKESFIEPEFLEIVRRCIGEELTAKHRYRILAYASAQQGLWTVSADGSNLTLVNSDTSRKDGLRWARITGEAARAIRERQRKKGKRKK